MSAYMTSHFAINKHPRFSVYPAPLPNLERLTPLQAKGNSFHRSVLSTLGDIFLCNSIVKRIADR